ncbi:MAG: high-affinity branched-chain amino acid ABC transporter ATP-binding protein LivG [Gammaproteobacteria bacterium]|nr:MAG: high-affinity branched-chain amino acid ABC transporter ATP-binding protein LivG [Gammaproteobacteria bacterium]
MSKHPNVDALTVKNLKMQFGGLVAVDNVNFNLQSGQIAAIIGPNGAGKTTIFNCISGFYTPTAGEVWLGDDEITGLPSHEVAKLGLMRTFQNIRLFKEMTVLENLLVAQHNQLNNKYIAGLLRLPSFKRAEERALHSAVQWLEIFGLREFSNREAGNLSYGQQRRLEIARCMITEPKILILDEPAAGLNPQETQELIDLIRLLRDEHRVSVVLIEHDMNLVMNISENILVVEYGRPIAEGSPEAIRNNPEVIKAYLGEE